MQSGVLSALHSVFYPRSVAVIGASASPSKWGFRILSRLIGSNPDAKLYAVNPKGGTILGCATYAGLGDIPGAVDLAVIVVPEGTVPAVMEECVDRGVKAAIVITAGFKETGVDGARLEARLRDITREAGLRFVGPNCNGHFNAEVGLFTTGPRGIRPGPVGLISQSGNFGTYILNRGIEKGTGFSKYVSSGNEADITIEDYLQYLADDEQTKVICAYIEGVKDGRRFFDLAKHISKEKPIVVMKSGRTERAARAVLSHTGALAGADEVHDAMFHQCGVVRVDEVDELLDVALALVRQPLPRGRRVGIMTSGGGFGVVATDACLRYGLEVPPLLEETIEAMNKYLPPRWPHSNPVDMAGALEGSYGCLGTLLKAPNIDAVLAIGSLGFPADFADDTDPLVSQDIRDYIRMAMETEVELIDGLVERVYRHQKPLIVTTPVAGETSPALARLQEEGIYTYRTPEEGVKVVSYLVRYAEYLRSVA
ncbi:MAG: acetate--CoA ligase family protein [Chloroflexota bacterium]